MSTIFNPPETAKPVEGVQGTAETQNDGKSDNQAERTYTAADMEAIVRDRVVRQDRAHQKELKKLSEKLSEFEKQRNDPKSQNLEEDFRTKLAQHETEKRTLQEKLAKIQIDGLRATVKAKLATAGCVDPDDISDLFLARKMVELDDDGNVHVTTMDKSLDDLVNNYLSSKPHLLKASSGGGLGTKGPVNPAVSSGQKTVAEMEAALGITSRKINKLFGRQ